MNTFEDFANTTIKASKIIKQDEAEALLAANNVKALWEYAYRVASLVVVYCKPRLPKQVDETDYQDAVQDAMTAFPEWLEGYDASKAPFLRYISYKCQNHIVRYLWTVVNGGTGSYDSWAQPTVQFDSIEEDSNLIDEDIGEMAQESESIAFGTRDPMVEAMAEETAKRAFKYAEKVGKHILGPWSEPELNPKSHAA